MGIIVSSLIGRENMKSTISCDFCSPLDRLTIDYPYSINYPFYYCIYSWLAPAVYRGLLILAVILAGLSIQQFRFEIAMYEITMALTGILILLYKDSVIPDMFYIPVFLFLLVFYFVHTVNFASPKTNYMVLSYVLGCWWYAIFLKLWMLELARYVEILIAKTYRSNDHYNLMNRRVVRSYKDDVYLYWFKPTTDDNNDNKDLLLFWNDTKLSLSGDELRIEPVQHKNFISSFVPSHFIPSGFKSLGKVVKNEWCHVLIINKEKWVYAGVNMQDSSDEMQTLEGRDMEFKDQFTEVKFGCVECYQPFSERGVLAKRRDPDSAEALRYFKHGFSQFSAILISIIFVFSIGYTMPGSILFPTISIDPSDIHDDSVTMYDDALLTTENPKEDLPPAHVVRSLFLGYFGYAAVIVFLIASLSYSFYVSYKRVRSQAMTCNRASSVIETVPSYHALATLESNPLEATTI